MAPPIAIMPFGPFALSLPVGHLNASIHSTLHYTKDASSSGGACQADVKVGPESSWSTVHILHWVHLTINLLLTLINGVQLELLQYLESQRRVQFLWTKTCILSTVVNTPLPCTKLTKNITIMKKSRCHRKEWKNWKFMIFLTAQNLYMYVKHITVRKMALRMLWSMSKYNFMYSGVPLDV